MNTIRYLVLGKIIIKFWIAFLSVNIRNIYKFSLQCILGLFCAENILNKNKKCKKIKPNMKIFVLFKLADESTD